jgi:hypothetical protein
MSYAVLGRMLVIYFRAKCTAKTISMAGRPTQERLDDG